MFEWKIIALLSALLTLSVVGCGDDGDDGGGASDQRVSDAEPAPAGDPVALGVDNVMIPVAHDDMEIAAQIASSFQVLTAFDKAVLRVQVIDEREALNSSPTTIQQNPAPVQVKRRLADLLDEIDAGIAASGSADWGEYVVVFDLFRVNGNWLVRWDGVGLDRRDEPGSYGLWRDDMRDQLAELIMDGVDEAMERKTVSHVVIGDGMERLLLINPEDFANFVSFFEAVREEIRAKYPDIAVAPGLNWDRMVSDVVPLFEGLEDDGQTHRFSAMRRMWQYIGQPLYANADFIALSSEPNPEDFGGDPEAIPTWHYALLAEVQGDKPLVWTSVNWPVTSSSEKARQRDFLRHFLALNAGNDVQMVAWKSMMDLVPNICDGYVSNLGMERTDCFSGMFSSSVAPTKLSDEFELQ